MSRIDTLLSEFSGDDFDHMLCLCSTTELVVRTITESESFLDLVRELRKNRDALERVVRDMREMVEAGSASEFKNDRDSLLAALACVVAAADFGAFISFLTVLRDARNLWWAGWVAQHIVEVAPRFIRSRKPISQVFVDGEAHAGKIGSFRSHRRGSMLTHSRLAESMFGRPTLTEEGERLRRPTQYGSSDHKGLLVLVEGASRSRPFETKYVVSE